MRNIARRDRTQPRVVTITAIPLGAGQFEARCDGEVIVVRTRRPLLDGARALLDAGHTPETVAVMRHAGSDVNALTALIGVAVAYYIEESAYGPVLRSLRKAARSAVDRLPVAQPCQSPNHPHIRRRKARMSPSVRPPADDSGGRRVS